LVRLNEQFSRIVISTEAPIYRGEAETRSKATSPEGKSFKNRFLDYAVLCTASLEMTVLMTICAASLMEKIVNNRQRLEKLDCLWVLAHHTQDVFSETELRQDVFAQCQLPDGDVACC
jgi:hypothetical protein